MRNGDETPGVLDNAVARVVVEAGRTVEVDATSRRDALVRPRNGGRRRVGRIRGDDDLVRNSGGAAVGHRQAQHVAADQVGAQARCGRAGVIERGRARRRLVDEFPGVADRGALGVTAAAPVETYRRAGGNALVGPGIGGRRRIGRAGVDADEGRRAVDLAVVDDQLEPVIAGLVGEEQRPRAVDADECREAAGRAFLERPQIRQAVAVRIAAEASVDFDVGASGDVAVASGVGDRRAIDVEPHFGREQALQQALEARRDAQPHRHRFGENGVERVEVVAGDGVAVRSVVVQRAEHRDRCAGVVQALQVDGSGDDARIVDHGGHANGRRHARGDARRCQLHRTDARRGPGGERQQQADKQRQSGQQGGEPSGG
ncbi:MAG: hypothetical protein AW09_001933 [Candidatus Accumulibacter phosphatis]|uniref:Uncharacterized protein n=1 Tax=Candidatus Accumulibacter phosphatis TaxID=327160 RepID=A0A080M6V6_9PROT|nr:MAG: hypothetical protein AW09_001933 [Candidatus Accumulibacter phosphatis]